MRTSNPTLGANTFNVPALKGENTMTIYGTACKTLILTLLVVISAAWMWNSFPPVAQGEIASYHDIKLPPGSIGWVVLSMIGGFLVALVTCFVPRIAWLTAPLYALLEGLFIGTISACFEGVFPGIVIQAVGLTGGTLVALLLVYMSGLIKPTENFKLGVAAATGGICLLYLFTIILGLFGIQMPFVHDTGVVGILFSLFVVVVAALNLVLDFDFIEQGSAQGAPRYMEWYAAFGLLVTLIWLYIEVLKLIAKLRSKK